MVQKKATLRPSPTAILNPRLDPIFKAIFTQGTEESDLALKGLLTAAIGKQVISLTLQPNEPPVEIPKNMQMSFDVSVVFNDGERADIEVQGRQYDYDYDFGTRAEIQSARLLNMNAKKGNEWQTEKVYQISVLNFEYDKDDMSAVSWYNMRSDSGGRLGDSLNVIFLDLVKIRRLKGTPPENLSPIEKWGMFFAFEDNPKEQEYLAKVKENMEDIMAADFIVKRMSEEDANWAFENSLFIGTRDYNARMHCAERKGLQKGLEKGLEKGLKKGAMQNARENARNLLKKSNLSAEMIADCCSLPLEQVLAIKEELETEKIES
ncbi:MAG: Rpn family recombination-promoting nuclease/putative transposase [Treponema sp.]|uniref:Rpn family recombination-promoting nuclease/putative transposase n=1 Tax=Treponema sp. TaxID=166 RepID=UPI0025D780C9|nr:Rpn family recombination-promoting nuclease/putative transposase [Treponema sp.]MBR0496085.1 Rpn family recombination-promoting nuclease/putative transposase [Treponema sp.]